MKIAISLISSLIMGLMLKDLFELRRRLVAAFVLASCSFAFAISSVVIAAIDVALQIENQGFVAWSAVLVVAVCFLGLALLFLVLTRVTFPKISAGDGLMNFARQNGLLETPDFAAEMAAALMRNFDESQEKQRPNSQSDNLTVQREGFATNPFPVA